MSPVIAVPCRPSVRTPASGLPAARTAEVAGCGTALTIDVDERPADTVLRADGEIDILTVDLLRAALDRGIATGKTIVADLRGVSFVDCAGVGLIVDARRRAHRGHLRLEIVPGPVVARTAALLGLTAALGLTERG